MGLAVKVRDQQGAIVVTLVGAAEPELLERLGDTIAQLGRDDGPLVIDLSGVVLLSGPALRRFLTRMVHLPRSEVRLVCSRLSGRKAMRQCAPELYLDVFGSIDTALADRTLASPA